jgi:hypothetical protein
MNSVELLGKVKVCMFTGDHADAARCMSTVVKQNEMLFCLALLQLSSVSVRGNES